MNPSIEINGRRIGPGYPTYIVAEMSANHSQNFDLAVQIVEAAKKVGADAIKVQTYTPETMTIDCDDPHFRIQGTPWHGRTFYDLYGAAYTPWDWHPRLKQISHELGMDFFSTPFDETAVDFLESINVAAYKIASFETVDLPLLRKIAETGKPIIMSCGMATLAEIDEAVATVREGGGSQLALLKCTSAYPSPPEGLNLRTIPHLAEAFSVPVGLSDHTPHIAVPVAAVALGACIIEKHLTLSRAKPGPDSDFSLEPQEFMAMVQEVRITEKALGATHYGMGEDETESRAFRRSLFVVKDMKAGDRFSTENVRSIRPGYGLHTRYLKLIIGRHANRSIKRGTPLSWDMIGELST